MSLIGLVYLFFAANTMASFGDYGSDGALSAVEASVGQGTFSTSIVYAVFISFAVIIIDRIAYAAARLGRGASLVHSPIAHLPPLSLQVQALGAFDDANGDVQAAAPAHRHHGGGSSGAKVGRSRAPAVRSLPPVVRSHVAFSGRLFEGRVAAAGGVARRHAASGFAHAVGRGE